MIAQLRETFAHLRSDHDALCSLLIKKSMISTKGLAQEKHLQRIQSRSFSTSAAFRWSPLAS